MSREITDFSFTVSGANIRAWTRTQPLPYDLIVVSMAMMTSGSTVTSVVPTGVAGGTFVRFGRAENSAANIALETWVGWGWTPIGTQSLTITANVSTTVTFPVQSSVLMTYRNGAIQAAPEISQVATAVGPAGTAATAGTVLPTAADQSQIALNVYLQQSATAPIYTRIPAGATNGYRLTRSLGGSSLFLDYGYRVPDATVEHELSVAAPSGPWCVIKGLLVPTPVVTDPGESPVYKGRHKRSRDLAWTR